MKKKYHKPIMHYTPNVTGLSMESWAQLNETQLMENFKKCRDAEYSIKYVVNPEIIERQIADEWLLVPVGKFAEANNCMISLNSTSHFLWNLFKTPCTLNEALKKAKETYEDATRTMEVEVREFVTEYSHLQLLLKA